MQHSPYTAHRAFISPAFKRSGLMLAAFGFGIIEFGYMLGYDLLDEAFQAVPPAWADAFYTGATPLGLAAQLLSFIILAAPVMLVTRFLHHRSPLTLIGPLGLTWRQFLAVFVPLMLLLLALELVPPWWSSEALDSTRSLPVWLMLLPPALLAIFVQIGAEELLYRGYLQQQLATVFKHPASWLILTNLAFGLAHWDTGAGGTASAQYVIWAFFFGLCASDLTARSGTLGPALALHLANNAFAFLLYGETDGPSSGFALFLFAPETMGAAFDTGEPSLFSWPLALELGILLVMWLTARIGLKR
ncbi:CPBP family intramembrane glutamic endopeptidase [Lentibacter sp. XHP0401]|uniref:CPBP family intramembrane glutamic endopeptidase n=1 Tax=Lentibacter sp. XHP0401 TaxID=2984334 RepID=UPI0021E70088|nr:type II CAAX endopeptidase family protein [Lentibacter sp. XHP0401]MCV2893802.1 CPBP family intramembrane metalloprotease [Lentibacter sp. XHP0401]